MRPADLLSDLVLVGAVGLAAGKIMDLSTTALLARQSEPTTRREQQASYGVAYEVAAGKAGKLLGRELSPVAVERLGAAFHQGLALGWVPVYLLARRRFGLRPVPASLVTGMSLEVLVDEIGNPLLGLTPGPRAYPLATHLRGLVGHLVYGTAVAVLVEAAWAARGRRP